MMVLFRYLYRLWFEVSKAISNTQRYNQRMRADLNEAKEKEDTKALSSLISIILTMYRDQFIQIVFELECNYSWSIDLLQWKLGISEELPPTYSTLSGCETDEPILLQEVNELYQQVFLRYFNILNCTCRAVRSTLEFMKDFPSNLPEAFEKCTKCSRSVRETYESFLTEVSEQANSKTILLS